MPTRWFLALVALPAVAFAAPCVDTAGVATTRAAIEAACPCATIPDARTYRTCARAVMTARADDGTLARECRRTVRRCARRSTCGRPGKVACCRPTAGGGTRCRITTPARCAGAGGCASVHASCCDACGASGCAPTTTTTLGPRACGNYIIDAGEMCDGEPFCEDCFVIPRLCCQFNLGGGTCSSDATQFFICDTGHPSSEQSLYGVFATGTPGACADGFSNGGPCSAPASLLPTSICCAKPGVCTSEIVSDSAELTLRIVDDECYEIVGGQFVPVSVVGYCDSPTGSCVRTH